MAFAHASFIRVADDCLRVLSIPERHWYCERLNRFRQCRRSCNHIASLRTQLPTPTFSRLNCWCESQFESILGTRVDLSQWRTMFGTSGGISSSSTKFICFARTRRSGRHPLRSVSIQTVFTSGSYSSSQFRLLRACKNLANVMSTSAHNRSKLLSSLQAELNVKPVVNSRRAGNGR